MHFQIPFKPSLLLLSLFTAVAAVLISVFLLLRLDSIVNETLYGFGLTFSLDWAEKYWLYARLTLALFGVTVVVNLLLAAYVQVYVKSENSLRRSVAAFLLLTGFVTSGLSAFFLTRLDLVVHGDLYKFGLQFNSAWASVYWTYLGLALGLVILVATVNMASTAYVLAAPVTADLTASKLSPWVLLASGAVSVVLSFVFESPIAAFLGLGLLFWGIIIFYVGSQEYVKANLLVALTLPSLVDLDKMLASLGFSGKTFYLPPRYLKNVASSKIYISEDINAGVPMPASVAGEEDKVFLDSPRAVVIDPPGDELAQLFEKTLGIEFAKVDLAYLQKKLPDLIVENLEIAKAFDMQIEKDKVDVAVENLTLKDVCKEVRNLAHIYGCLGCPLSSAIGCALAKATGKLVAIENELISEDGKNIDVEFRLFEPREE